MNKNQLYFIILFCFGTIQMTYSFHLAPSVQMRWNNDPDSKLTKLLYSNSDDVNAMRQLIHQGANINKQNGMGNTPLMIATLFNNTPMVKELLNEKAEVNLKNRDGDTALLQAASNDNPEIFKLLLDAKADRYIKNKKDKTVYDIVQDNSAIKKILDDLDSKQDQYNKGIVGPMIVKNIEEVEFPKELSRIVADYAKIENTTSK